MSIDQPPPDTASPAPPADSPAATAIQAGTQIHGATPSESTQERVRQILAELDGIEESPLAEHVERYGAVHTRLQAALSEIDGPAGG